ncbi:OmpA family protein [Candidatus Neomarinimicrobiota bacterium]
MVFISAGCASRASLDEAMAEAAREQARQQSDYDALTRSLQEEIAAGQLTIQRLEGRLAIVLVNRVLFNSGEAIILPPGREVLDQVGAALATINDKRIVIEGHTDDVAIGQRLAQVYPSNWELSTARATNVARYMIANSGINEYNISVAGFAYTRPVATNATEEGRAQNRRIEILLFPLESYSPVLMGTSGSQ